MKKKNFVKRILAIVLAMVLVASGLPDMGQKAYAAENSGGVVATVDDPQTLTRPMSTYGNSTLNAGKILVGKSVTDGIDDATGGDEPLNLNSEIYNMTDKDAYWLPDDGNFLVTISQSSQMYGVSSEIPIPLDVVFVLDTSGSMDQPYKVNGVRPGGATTNRAQDAVAAINETIADLMELNEYNRVSVVTFSAHNSDWDNEGMTTAGNAAASVLSPLAHYSGAAATSHLTWRGNAGDMRYLWGRNANGNVANSRNGYSGGTNIQSGMYLGAQQLLNVTDPTVIIDGKEITRMPFIIFVSDGAPVASSASNTWWIPSMTAYQGDLGTPFAGNAFLPILVASYYKQQITEKYYPDGDGAVTFYTIGVGLNSENRDETEAMSDLARMVLNPKEEFISTSGNQYYREIEGYWNHYLAEEDFRIRVDNPRDVPQNNVRYTHDGYYYFYRKDTRVNSPNDYLDFTENSNGTGDADTWVAVPSGTVMKDNILEGEIPSLRYNDDYYDVEDSSDLTETFKALVIEIQKRAITVPTLTDITMGDNFSGYVTFTDPIGEYMEVKEFKGVTGDGYLYQGKSLAELASKYDPQWQTKTNDEDQRVFNEALEQAIMDRIKFSSQGSAVTPSLAQVRAILDVVTMTETEGSVNYNNGSENRTFEYEDYGGQLYYDPATGEYGNSFVWFGRVHYPEGSTQATNDEYNVEFIGVAPKNADSALWLQSDEGKAMVAQVTAPSVGANCIVRSYFMYGTAGGDRTEPADMLHFQLRVITDLDAPYQQTVSIKTPASLLAMQKVLIDDTDKNNPIAHYDELITTRVTYEVGLRSDITPDNMWSIVSSAYTSETLADGTLANVNSDGSINFYTNDWDRKATLDSHERALANATFDVSNSNSFYRYEKDTQLLDASGNPVTKLEGGQNYYYNREYYTWTPNEDTPGEARANKTSQLIRVTIDADWKESGNIIEAGGHYYIKEGTYTAFTLTAGDDLTKIPNETGTSSVISHPERTNSEDDSHYTVWLGNNGRLTYVGVPAKTVYKYEEDTTGTAPAPTLGTANIDGELVKVGDILNYQIQATNGYDENVTVKVTDTLPAGTELVTSSIKHGVKVATQSGTEIRWSGISGGVYEEATRTITWEIKDVAPGTTVVVSFDVVVTEGAVVVAKVDNQALIEMPEVQNSYTTNITSNPVSGKKAGTTTGAEISEEGLKIGDMIEYKIAYHNTTKEVAVITVKDIVPEGTVFHGVTSHTAELTWDQEADPQTLEWKFVDVQPGASGVVTFVVTIDESIEKVLIEDPYVVENSAYYIIDPANGSDVTIETNPTEVLVDTGDLQLKKAVTGTTAADVTFELVLTESTGKLNGEFAIAGTQNKVIFADGEAKVMIKAGETITITGLPEGVIIHVVETARDGYAATYYLGEDTTAPVGSNVTINSEAVSKVFVLNTYSTTNTPDISTMFSIRKTLTSPVALEGRTFTFTAQAADENGTVLTGADAETLTVSGTVKGGETITLHFQGKTFSAAGDYYYVVSEHKGVLEGITYDNTQYMVWIHVEDNGAGQLIASTQTKKVADTAWGQSTELTFNNSYKPADTSIVLEGTKELNGRDLIESEFTFVATETSAPAGVTREVVRYGHHDAQGNITFDPIFYSVEGEYVYEIKELKTTGQDNMTWDESVKTVTVVVSNANGVLSAVVKNGSDAILFSNTYTTQDVTVTIKGAKTLTGRPMKAGEFSFEIYDESGAVKAGGTVTAGASGQEVEFEFSPLTYGLEDMDGATQKVFTYTIKELLPTVRADEGIVYDQSEYTFTVTVTYDATSGELKAEPSAITQTKNSAGEAVNIVVSDDIVRFANTYNPPPVDVIPGTVGLGINKVITSESNIPDGLTFGFLVYKADQAYAPDGSVIEDGYEYYGQTENNASKALVGTGNSAPAQDNVTTYPVSFSELTFSKPGVYKAWIVEANAGAQDLHGVDYSATRYLMVITITHDTSNGVLVADVDYYEAGTVNEAWSAAAYVGGTPASVPLVFVNDYEATGNMTIKASKAITGRNLADVANKFDFTLTELDGQGNPTDNVHVGKNDANGNIVFDTLNFVEFTEDTKTITYLMAETPGVLDGITYDKSQYKVTVELGHDGQGGITSEIVSIVKIQDAEGDPVNVSVSIKDIHGDTGIVFANTGNIYKGTSITIPLTKELTGRTMIAGEFGFELIHVATNGQAVEHKTVASATSLSEAMSFYREYGTGVAPNTEITYWIQEIQGSKGGVTYDKSRYEVKVLITDEDQNGELQIKAGNISVTKIKNATGQDVQESVDFNTGIQFHNEYKVSSTTLLLEGTKNLTGRDISVGEFVFEVYELNADGTRKYADPVTTGTVPAGPEGTVNIAFDPITYYAAGNHSYEVVERAGNRANVTYSKAKYVVTVHVTDNGDGTLAANVTNITKTIDDAGAAVEVTDAAIGFHNTYVPAELNLALYLDINKILAGRDMEEDEFDFIVTEVSPVAGKIVSYGSHGAAEDGESAKVTFASFTVTEAGTYVYEITEGSTARPNVTTDKKKIVVTIVVRDDTTTGKLVWVSTTYSDGNAVDGDDQTFSNGYDPTPAEMELYATKSLDNLPLLDGMFTFVAKLEKKDSEGKYQLVKEISVTNEAGGLVEFGVQELDVAGEYRWTVTEVAEIEDMAKNPTGGLLTFDNTVYYVYVTVTDDADTGVLSITELTYAKVADQSEEDVSAIGFKNVFTPTQQYKPLDAVLKTDGSKVLNGREMIEGEFAFSVKNVESVVVATGYNDEKGNIIVDYDLTTEGVDGAGIEFTAPGHYFYTVEEVVGNGAAMSYDPAVWTVRYDVTQEERTGKLIVSDPVVTQVSGSTVTETEQIVFTNTYDADDVQITLIGLKNLIGDRTTPRAGEFIFHLINDADGSIAARGTTDDQGQIVFETMNFDTVDTYDYTLVEVLDSAAGVEYNVNNNTYDVKILVSEVMTTDDAGNVSYAGKLQAAVTVDGEPYTMAEQIQFTNKFTADPVKVTVEATKKLTGADIADYAGKFTFVINNEAGFLLATGTNDAEGRITFDQEIALAAGLGQKLIISEQYNSELSHMKFDETKFEVIVDVVSEDGVLKATVTYPDGGIVFNNTYDKPEPTPQPDPEPEPTPEPPAPPASNPDTGDTANMGLWTCLMGISLLVAAAVVVADKRRRRIME